MLILLLRHEASPFLATFRRFYFKAMRQKTCILRKRQADLAAKTNLPDMDKKNPYYKELTKALETPKDYKVCSACGFVVSADEEDCPYCAAYRFDSSAETVSNAALDQLARPFDRVIDPTVTAYD